jgi:hypothetical protein
MGFVKFERFFRAAGGVTVDRDDMKHYLDFVNDAIYDLLIIGQATAKANVRDVIEPWDLPITKGLQESMHQFEKLEEQIELRPILESLAARPPLDATLDEETQARLLLIFGGISVALARTFKLIDAELKAVHTLEWERTFSLFRLLILTGAGPGRIIAWRLRGGLACRRGRGRAGLRSRAPGQCPEAGDQEVAARFRAEGIRAFPACQGPLR